MVKPCHVPPLKIGVSDWSFGCNFAGGLGYYPFKGPNNKDYSIWWSILGSPIQGNCRIRFQGVESRVQSRD